jgi:hypothetical protein
LITQRKHITALGIDAPELMAPQPVPNGKDRQ